MDRPRYVARSGKAKEELAFVAFRMTVFIVEFVKLDIFGSLRVENN